MRLSDEDFKKLANLAKLEFSEDEVDDFKEKISSVIAYLDKLDSIDTDGVEPLIYLNEVEDSRRKDEIKKSISVELATKNAPKSSDGAIIVPKVVGE